MSFRTSRRVRTIDALGLAGLLAASAPEALTRPAADSASPLASPMQTNLDPADPSGDGPERITVLGRRTPLRTAPLPDYGSSRAPWEVGRAIRDTMTGADTARFGDAYNLGSPLGSDERSNETGGPFVAPRHE